MEPDELDFFSEPTYGVRKDGYLWWLVQEDSCVSNIQGATPVSLRWDSRKQCPHDINISGASNITEEDFRAFHGFKVYEFIRYFLPIPQPNMGRELPVILDEGFSRTVVKTLLRLSSHKTSNFLSPITVYDDIESHLGLTNVSPAVIEITEYDEIPFLQEVFRRSSTYQRRLLVFARPTLQIIIRGAFNVYIPPLPMPTLRNLPLEEIGALIVQKFLQNPRKILAEVPTQAPFELNKKQAGTETRNRINPEPRKMLPSMNPRLPPWAR